MYNKGRMGRRANDSEGVTKIPRNFYETQSPIPTIDRYDVCELGTYVPLDDTALDTAGDQTIVVHGAGFSANATMQLDGANIAAVTWLDPTRLTFTSTAKASGTFSLLVDNGNGNAALLVPGIVYSGSPTFQSPAAGSIGSFYEVSTISETITATSDSNITYTISSGSLPTGVTLSSLGVLSGTSPVDNSATTYSFTVKATDQEGQDAFRSYSLTINTDVVTWASPADNAVFELVQDQAIDPITLNASSAAGKTIVYSADLLPTGVSLSGDTITGTPTDLETVSTTLTATANATNRFSTRNVSWSVVVAADPFFRYTALVLNGEISLSNAWNDDASDNKFQITTSSGDPEVNLFNPYLSYYSGYFDGTSDRLEIANNTALNMGTGNFTVEAWVFSTASQGASSGIVAKGGASTGFTINVTGTTVFIAQGGTATLLTSASGAVPLNTWTHVAYVRNSTTIYLFVNGIQVDTGTSSYDLTETNVLRIGANRTNGAQFQGYISNVRILKGTALYTSGFTVPNSPLTAIANTVLLTCQSNRFIDNSVNNFAITVTDAQVSGRSPFVETNLNYGSGHFDGSNDSLLVPGNTAFNFISSNYTLECWIYPTALAGTQCILDAWNNAPTRFLLRTSATSLQFYASYGNTSYTLPSTHQWYHVAAVRNGSTTTLYVNGVSSGTISSTSSITDSVANWTISRSTETFYGHIADVRIVKGVAVYTGNFTPPTAPLATSGAASAASYPSTVNVDITFSAASTSLLTLQSAQGDNNHKFIDSSSNYHVVERLGNTSQGTFSPFSRSGWSNYFDGTGDYLTVASSANTALTTNDFTIEFFIFVSAATLPANITPLDYRTGTNGISVIRPVIELTSGNGYAWYVAASNKITSGTASVRLNAWQHLAIARSGTNTKMFLDGVQVGSTYTNDTNNYPAGDIRIGQANDGVSSRNLTGFISNLRIVIGTAVYTSNFTSPTARLTAIANTALLTCQSNRFIDNSANNFTITRSGDVSVQSISPFAPTASYTASAVGGSAYFDGTGDYLDLPSNAAFTLGTGDFTIEGWIYVSSGTTGTLYDSRTGSSTSVSPVIYLNSGVLTYFVAANRITGPTLVLASWHHVAVVRQSSSTKMYLNGVQVGSTYADSNNYVIGPPKIGAGYTNVNLLNGYISDLRLVKGTAMYTGNFTPPTAPLSLTNDTSLLLRFTNAGIRDLSGKNVIETGGTLKINNTTKKYDIRSLPFNGTSEYLVMPYSPIFNLSSGAFCIECWVNFSTLSGNRMLFDTYTAASAGGGYQLYWRGTGTSMTFYANGVIVAQSTFTSHVTGTWYHVAVTRDTAGLVKIFIDGTSYASATYTSAINMATTGKAALGRQNSTATNYFHGFIDDFRLTVGEPRYTSNFTPSQITRFK